MIVEAPCQTTKYLCTNHCKRMYSILQSCVEFTCKIQMFCEVMFFIFYNVFNLTFTFWIRLPTYMKIQSTSLFINSKILCQYKISAIFHLRESMRLGHLQAHWNPAIKTKSILII